jgi:hypothetical protein
LQNTTFWLITNLFIVTKMQAALAEHEILHQMIGSRACYRDDEENAAWELLNQQQQNPSIIITNNTTTFPPSPQRVIISCGDAATDGLLEALTQRNWNQTLLKFSSDVQVRILCDGQPNGIAIVFPSPQRKWTAPTCHAFAQCLFNNSPLPGGRDIYVLTTIRKSQRPNEAKYSAGPLRSLSTSHARVPSYIPPLEPTCIIGGLPGAIMHRARLSGAFCLIICAPRESSLDVVETLQPLAAGLLTTQQPLFRHVIGESACDAALASFNTWAALSIKRDERAAKATEPEGMYS